MSENQLTQLPLRLNHQRMNNKFDSNSLTMYICNKAYRLMSCELSKSQLEKVLASVPHSLNKSAKTEMSFLDSCYFRFEASEFYWEFSSSKCGTFIATYIDLSYSVGIMIVVAVFEFITFLKLKILRKVFCKLHTWQSSHA